MTKEIRLLINTSSGELDIVNEDGQMLTANSKEVKSVQQYLTCEEIKEELINRDEVKYNDELKKNIALIIDNYYIESMLMIQQNRDMIFRLAVAATRDLLEREEEGYGYDDYDADDEDEIELDYI